MLVQSGRSVVFHVFTADTKNSGRPQSPYIPMLGTICIAFSPLWELGEGGLYFFILHFVSFGILPNALGSTSITFTEFGEPSSVCSFLQY